MTLGVVLELLYTAGGAAVLLGGPLFTGAEGGGEGKFPESKTSASVLFTCGGGTPSADDCEPNDDLYEDTDWLGVLSL